MRAASPVVGSNRYSMFAHQFVLRLAAGVRRKDALAPVVGSEEGSSCALCRSVLVQRLSSSLLVGDTIAAQSVIADCCCVVGIWRLQLKS